MRLTRNLRIRCPPQDLVSLASCRSAAKSILAELEAASHNSPPWSQITPGRIDVLLLNAASAKRRHELVEDEEYNKGSTSNAEALKDEQGRYEYTACVNHVCECVALWRWIKIVWRTDTLFDVESQHNSSSRRCCCHTCLCSRPATVVRSPELCIQVRCCIGASKAQTTSNTFSIHAAIYRRSREPSLRAMTLLRNDDHGTSPPHMGLPNFCKSWGYRKSYSFSSNMLAALQIQELTWSSYSQVGKLFRRVEADSS